MKTPAGRQLRKDGGMMLLHEQGKRAEGGMIDSQRRPFSNLEQASTVEATVN